MVESLGDILSGKKPREPAEFPIIREFVQQKCDITPRLQLQNHSIVIMMPNSSAASSLQLQLHQLRQQLNTTKKLTIRVG